VRKLDGPKTIHFEDIIDSKRCFKERERKERSFGEKIHFQDVGGYDKMKMKGRKLVSYWDRLSLPTNESGELMKEAISSTPFDLERSMGRKLRVDDLRNGISEKSKGDKYYKQAEYCPGYHKTIPSLPVEPTPQSFTSYSLIRCAQQLCEEIDSVQHLDLGYDSSDDEN